MQAAILNTPLKASKYGVISGLHFHVFSPKTGKYGPEMTPYLDTFLVVRNRNSHWQMFFKIGALKNLAIFTGQHLHRSLFLMKLQTENPASLLRRDSNTVCFLVNIAKLLRTAFFWVAASAISSEECSILGLQKYMRRIFKAVYVLNTKVTEIEQ